MYPTGNLPDDILFEIGRRTMHSTYESFRSTCRKIHEMLPKRPLVTKVRQCDRDFCGNVIRVHCDNDESVLCYKHDSDLTPVGRCVWCESKGPLVLDEHGNYLCGVCYSRC